MKHLRTIILTTMAIFVSQTNANAQEVETKVVQQCSVTSDKGWRKYINLEFHQTGMGWSF